MNENKQLKLYRFLLIVSSIIFGLSFVFTVIFVFVPYIFGNVTTIINIICLVLAIVFLFGVVFSIVSVVEQNNFVKQLKLQNSYTLGHQTAFYDLAAFRNRATKMCKKRALSKMKQYVIVFTSASQDNSINMFGNTDMTTLNYEIALFVADYFHKGKGLSSDKYNVFGFNRGVFMLYSFTDGPEHVREIVNDITNAIFSIVTKENLKIWAQPFFGVREVNPGDNLTSAIEDAFSARNTGEANFESYTIFNKKTTNEEANTFLKEIEHALKNDEFVPYYQPKYSLKEKKFIGCEVLARWKSPTRGLLSPGMFIDKAEQFGLLSAIDLLIFEKGLADLSSAIKRGRRIVPISSNFSLYEFFSHSFLDTILELLDKYQVPANLVEIEITETTSQVNQFMSVSVIKKLKDKGIRVLMDDYGIGYSQISNLKNIPFDGIKIDKSFSDQMLDDEKARSIIKFLTELGHINGLEVIVEGVEKKEQVDLLRKMQVDTIQGFYYSKALPLDEFEKFLRYNEFEGGKK